ncbi:glycosyltransferase [Naumannella huperziae]
MAAAEREPAGPLRLAFVSMHTSPDDKPGSGDAGGMNVVESHQAFALAELGHSVELITRRSSPDQPELAELRPGVTLRRLTAGPAEPVAKSRQNLLIGEFSAQLAELDADWDLIHSQHWMSGVAALPVARALGVPHVQSYHSVAAPPGATLDEGEPPESADRVAGEALIARESDLVIAVSGHEAATIITRCGAAPDRVVVVRPGVDESVFTPDGEGFDWARIGARVDRRGVALFAARLQPLKGVALAIRAIARVPEEVRPALVLAGDASADHAGYADRLRELAEAEGIGGETTFTGPQERADLARMLRGAELVLVPSYSETFGLIALEALASGTPAAIWGGAGGLNEVVSDETGLVMADRDPDHWGAEIAALLRDPDRRRELSEAAVRRARRLGWPRAAQRLVNAYRHLLADERKDG